MPARSSDELGLLTHTFNHMTQRLAESQAEVANYQRTLEEKVAQRTRELEIATAHAYKLAQHDILTGLPNRSLLNQRLKQILAQAQRDAHHVACLFLDFDHFKRINDTLGHDAGDQLLQAIAQRLTNAVRESDTVARLGGDEFVRDPAGPRPGARDVRGHDRAHARARIVPGAVPPRRPDADADLLDRRGDVSRTTRRIRSALIKQADTAMYAAKDAGRNAYRFYTADMNARVQLRLQLETDMRRGLMDDEFFLVYQPQIEMRTGRACGVEALLRWRDPERGVIAPAEFIPVAEESGMIQALGARVLRDACRQVVEWHRHGHAAAAFGQPVGAATAARQLALDRRGGAVGERACRPSTSTSKSPKASSSRTRRRRWRRSSRLKQMGVSITVDDFGTGYSSLSYLARLPIQGVKIDQRFVHGLEKNRNDEAITQAIIALSHSLGLRCIAEGVETPAQFNFLKRAWLRGGAGLPDRPAAARRRSCARGGAQQEERRQRHRRPARRDHLAARDRDGVSPRLPESASSAGIRGGNCVGGKIASGGAASAAQDPSACRRRAGCLHRRRRQASAHRHVRGDDRSRAVVAVTARRAPGSGAARIRPDGRARRDRCGAAMSAPACDARQRPRRWSRARSTACRPAPRSSRRRPARLATPQRRLAPMPSSASRAANDARAGAPASISASSASPGRTTATTSGSASSRCRQ